MSLDEYQRKKLDEFFEATKLTLDCYKHTSFSYFAVKHGDGFRLCQGSLLLQWTPMASGPPHFRSSNVRAGIYRLDELNLTPRNFIETLLSGVLQTPQVELHFPPEKDRPYSIYFDPFYSNSNFYGVQPQGPRYMRLEIQGERHNHSIESRELDWELKAASPRFVGVRELCAEYGMGSINTSSIDVRIIATNVAAIAPDSFVSGPMARLKMVLADGLDREKASIGYRMMESGNKVVKRDEVLGKALSWTTAEGVQRGEVEIDVPVGSIFDCAANYAGEVQHLCEVKDPSTIQNPLRAIHEAFDNKAEVLVDFINKSSVTGKAQRGKGNRADDFEVAVAWLLGMLGFAVTHLGGTKRTSDAPDLVARTPQGHFAVVECTTGLLKEDRKLPHLCERRAKVKQSLAASGHAHLRVLAIIVTSKTREEVKAELEEAQKQNVFVVTRETIDGMLKRSLILPDADQLFMEAEESLRPQSLSLSDLIAAQNQRSATAWQ